MLPGYHVIVHFWCYRCTVAKKVLKDNVRLLDIFHFTKFYKNKYLYTIMYLSLDVSSNIVLSASTRQTITVFFSTKRLPWLLLFAFADHH